MDPQTCTEKTIVYQPCVVVPRDPNDILGPVGFGDERWVEATDTLPYTIRFENAPDASAAAHQVVITQTLDPDLDPRTFRVDDFGWGDLRVEVPGDKPFFQRRVDLPEDLGYFVDVLAFVDVTTGVATWTITTIDPATGEQPADARLGFLPPNDASGRGGGFVSYTVEPRRTAATGARLDAVARIVFDTEEPIDTPPAFNTLDATAPASAVDPLPEAAGVDEFLLSWHGSDDAGGSALADYTVFVSEDGGPYQALIDSTTLTEWRFTGTRGRTYAFYSVARDNAGNAEAVPPVPDARITLTAEAAEVRGVVYEDVDGDGVRDAGEPSLAGRVVYLDEDGDGVRDPAERSATTDESGAYTIAGLAPGTYVVVAALPAGWIATAPASGRSEVTLTSGLSLSDVDLGSSELGGMSGVVFEDVDGDGARATGEAGLAGWTVYLDADQDGHHDTGERSVVTGAGGAWAMRDLGPGTYLVRQVIEPGWAPTAPAGGTHAVTMTSGAAASGLDFGNVVITGAIQGTKFEDLDGDGLRDAGEPGLAGWTIFLDTDADGVLDGGEPFTVTDAEGAYAFTDLLPASYVVAEVPRDGWVQTFPGASGSGEAASTGGARLATTGAEVPLYTPSEPVTVDAGAAGTVTTETAHALTGLDALRADPRFAGLDGSGIGVVVIDTGIDLDHPFFGPDRDGDGIADRIVYQWDFADGDADASDRTGHGSHVASMIGSEDAAYGGVAPGADLVVLKVFEDSGRGTFAYLERALQWVVGHAAEYRVGVVNLSVGDGGNWVNAVSQYGLGDELAALAAEDVIVVAAAGNAFYQFGGVPGVAYPAADPSVLAVGAVWAGDFGGPWRFRSGATDYTTGADRIASFSQRDEELTDAFAPGARLTGASATGGIVTMQGTSQASAHVAGAAALAQQLAMAELGHRLSTAEFAALLATTGDRIIDGDDEQDNVANTGLVFPRVDVLRLAEAILALDGTTSDGGPGTADGSDGRTTPAPSPSGASGTHSVTLTPREVVDGIDFGNFELGGIAGVKFQDLDGNGVHAVGEPGLAGWTIYLDQDRDGQLGGGERAVTTDAGGHYAFEDLGPGTYVVAEVAQPGWAQTAPSGGTYEIGLTSGLRVGAADFGNRFVQMPPVAEPDSAVTDEDTPVTIDVLDNDSDANGDALVVVDLTVPGHGTVRLNLDGTVTYTPAPDYFGPDSFTYRATDGALASAVTPVTLTVTPVNDAPALAPIPDQAVEEGDTLRFFAGASDRDGGVLAFGLGPGAPTGTVVDPATGLFTWRPTASQGPGTYGVTMLVTDGALTDSRTFTITVVDPALVVTSIAPTGTGFQVRFNRAVDPGTLNLYDTETGGLGPADATLVGASRGPVRGSLVVGESGAFTFVRTGGVLEPDTYTVRLRGGLDGFRGSNGSLLDGDNDGVLGDDYTTTFTVGPAPRAVVGVPDFTRGPGQPVNVPATGAGIPIRLSNGAGVESVDLTLVYDPALLTVTGVTPGAALPAGAIIEADLHTPGRVVLALAVPTPLAASPIDLVVLTAEVPSTAPYRAAHVLDVTASLNKGAIAAVDGDGVHAVGYLGDTTGNGSYSSLDAQRVLRVAVGLDSGFSPYPLVDPVVIADITGNGAISALDATRILQEAVGRDRAEIPPLPPGPAVPQAAVRLASSAGSLRQSAVSSDDGADSAGGTAGVSAAGTLEGSNPEGPGPASRWTRTPGEEAAARVDWSAVGTAGLRDLTAVRPPVVTFSVDLLPRLDPGEVDATVQRGLIDWEVTA